MPGERVPVSSLSPPIVPSPNTPTTTAAGSYFLLACADDTKQVIETSETNNCKASAAKVTLGS